MMKRLLVTLSHPQHAGMLRALRILDDAAASHGWSMRYAFPGDHVLLDVTGMPRDRSTFLTGLGRWRGLRGRLSLPRAVAGLTRLAREADVIYSETLSGFPHSYLAGRLAGRPQVVHVYSSYGDPRPYRKHWLGRARHVVAPSADSLRLAAEAVGGFGPGIRARVVYNGMDVERIAQEAEAAPPPVLATDRPRVGMVGNLDWRKNPRLLVEAAPAIRAAIPDVQIALIGDFPNARAAAAVRQRISDLGLDDTVSITGFLPNPFPAVRRLDVLALPTLRDPFPLALLEGMALGRPIVASAVSGIPEMLVDGESGVLVPADDAPALADAIVGLLRDPARRRQIGAAAHQRLTSRFTLPEFARGMFEAFDDAARDGV
jgi:glycosyltransferase involved in cell wall biosynthesis